MYRYFVLNLLLKLRLCRYVFIKFKMAALNPCDFAVARQTFFERRATNFLGSTTIKIGSNYQKKLEASTRKVGNIYQKSWKHLPENLVATIFLVVRLYKRPIAVLAEKSVPEYYSVKKRYTLIRY